jgi:hypothetical protein
MEMFIQEIRLGTATHFPLCKRGTEGDLVFLKGDQIPPSPPFLKGGILPATQI